MTWRTTYWLIFAAMLVVYGTMVFWTLPAISNGAGGLPAFDLRPTGYSVSEAQAFLAAISDDARAIYQGPQRWLDMVYPVLLGLVLAGALWSLLAHPALRWGLILISIGAVLADYYENHLVAQMLAMPGEVDETLVMTASGATVVKSALSSIAMIALLIALVRAGITKWRAR